MKFGFIGGTFDPPHLGHLMLAQEALEQFSLEKVFFVPSRKPPHKNSKKITEISIRLKMLALAISGNSSFEIADLEPHNSPSYTVDLLKKLSASDSKPSFIIGMDSLVELHTWKNPMEILQISDVLVGTRPDTDSSKIEAGILSQVKLFNFPGIWISSSELRDRVSLHRKITYLVPEAVDLYIRTGGLYGAEKGH